MREELQGYQFALKGLVRCDACGSTLVYSKANDGLQCHSYGRGVCQVSHYINLPTLNQMVLDAMKEAVINLSFNLASDAQESPNSSPIDFDAMIRAEALKMERARQAYQEGVDSLSEYKANKMRIEQQIEKYKKQKSKATEKAKGIDLKKFAKTVTGVIEIMENPNASEELKNKALKSVLQKIVFYKPERRIELFFYI